MPSFTSLPNMAQAARILKDGGIALYPTETFIALGCHCGHAASIRAVRALKGRSPGKPLPLIAGNLAQAETLCDLSSLPPALISRFWPGPLTVIVPLKKKIGVYVADRENMVAIRVTSHPVAATLALLTGAPLVSTSANFSGFPPQNRLDRLDINFMRAFNALELPVAISPERPECPFTGAPSTIVKVETGPDGRDRMRILRHGAISAQALEAAGLVALP